MSTARSSGSGKSFAATAAGFTARVAAAVIALGTVGLALPVPNARAGFFEISSGFNFTRSKYAGGSYSWSRRLGGSIGYNFGDNSTIEMGYQKSYERNHYQGFEDSFYDDKVYSVNWVQHLTGRESTFQPYFKLGIGQLLRKASIYDNLGRSQVTELNQVTGIAGAGFKIKLTKTFGLRLEGTSYLSQGKIETWRDNFAMTFGGSLYF